MRYHYVWLAWAGAFLVPWIALYVANPLLRGVMLRTSAATALFGLTEPIFVPAYWNPPSLFELAQRTGFDVESIIFSFAIGGIGATLYKMVTRTHLAPVGIGQRSEPLHRFHRFGLLVAPVAFVPLTLPPWNVIYAVIVALALGSVASVICRPHLVRTAIVGGLFFFGLYAVFMFGLTLIDGYIPQVWNLPALSGLLIGGIPLEELLFGAAFGMYWSSVYEHFTWTETVPHSHSPGPKSRPWPARR